MSSQAKTFIFTVGARPTAADRCAKLCSCGYTGVQDSKSYYVTIKELHTMGNGAYAKRLRVAGNVQPGSIKRVGTHVQFVLVEETQTLAVDYTGTEAPPDTFKDDSQALADGNFGHDGVFLCQGVAGEVRFEVCAEAARRSLAEWNAIRGAGQEHDAGGTGSGARHSELTPENLWSPGRPRPGVAPQTRSSKVVPLAGRTRASSPPRAGERGAHRFRPFQYTHC